MQMFNNKLDSQTIDEVKAKARKKLIEYSKLNDVIGGQIFNILELENKVLYYPIDDEEVWGFSEKIKGKSFVKGLEKVFLKKANQIIPIS